MVQLLERLFTIWKEKVHSPNYQGFYEKYVKSMIPLHHGKMAPPTARQAWDTNLKIPFQSFSRWLLRLNSHFDKDEFMPVTRLCPVCQFRPNFIGHTGDISNELQ